MEIKKSALVYVKELGQGAFGSVYQMTWRSPDGPIDVAAKKLNKKDKHELEVLSRLDHPNIVKLIGVVDEAMDFMLVLELCEGGSLRSYLKARNGRPLSEKQFYDWAEQAARPLEYLRENNWIHKDVKSLNYMISQNMLKLGDFGLAKDIDRTIGNATETASWRWMAPELLVRGILSPKYDIFALAVVLWELWTVSFPWEGVQNHTIVYKVCQENKRLPIPEDCPEPFKDLLTQCWQTDWKQRPDIIQVLQVITSMAAQAAAAAAATQPAADVVEIPAAALSVRQIIAGPWNMVRQFGMQDGPGKLNRAYHMVLSPDGDLVIADMEASQIKIYNIKGEYKSSIHTRSNPRQIAISSDNTCFMTDISQHIKIYELGGKYKGSWVASCPDASSRAPQLIGLAIDHAGDLLLGDDKNKYIYKHKQDGTHVASIKVGIEPKYIAVTSQGTIVVAGFFTASQIISNTGQVLHTLKLPVDESQWNPFNIYCHDGIIFVCISYSILCCSESGEYLGSMPLSSENPYGGCVMTSDSKTLLVCESHSVKVFTAPSIQQ